MDERTVQGLMGLAMKAGLFVFGQENIQRLVQKKKVVLLLADCGASANTQKQMRDMGRPHDLTLHLLPAGMLAKATGKDGRKVAAMADHGLTRKIMTEITKGCVEQANSVEEQ